MSWLITEIESTTSYGQAQQTTQTYDGPTVREEVQQAFQTQEVQTLGARTTTRTNPAVTKQRTERAHSGVRVSFVVPIHNKQPTATS